MKKVITLLSLLLMAVMTVGAQTVISIGASTGTFYSGTDAKEVTATNQYLNRWVSNTTPALTFSCSAGNMVVNSNLPTDTKFNLHTDPINYTLSYPDGKILSYTIKAYVTNSGKINGTDVSTDPDNPTEITVSDINATTASLVIANTANPWMYITEFTVTVESPSEEQLEASEKAKSWFDIMQGQALVTDASNYLSAHKQADEGTYAALLDKNNGTFFHSAWGGGSAAKAGLPEHDLQAKLPEGAITFYMYFVSRSNGTGIPQAFRIDGSNNESDFTEDHEATTSWTEAGSLSGGMPTTASTAYLSPKVTLNAEYQYLRFVPTSIYSNQSGNWFCLAEFWLLPSNEATDAAIEFLKEGKGALDLTAEDINKINEIDQMLKSTSVNVTYELYDNGTKVNSVDVVQGKNSAVSLPEGLTKGYSPLGYDFPTTGEVGTSDCTITVTATLKEGVVTDLANLSNDKAYRLTTERGTLGTNGTQMVSTNGTSFSASDFAVINYDEKYYLWSIVDSKFVANKEQPALTDNVAEAGTLVFDPTGNDKPLFFMGMGSNGVNVSNYNTGIVVNSWTTRDPGNRYLIKENGDFDPTAAIAALDTYFNPAYTITYVVNDENGEQLFVSDPVGTTEGATITTLPEEYQHPGFYTYNEVNVTISDAETTIEFTATLKEEPLFVPGTVENPVWHTMEFTAANNIPTYSPDDPNTNVTIPTTVADDVTTQHWNFVGNPYAGFKIMNRAAGDLVLGSAATTHGQDDNGGNVLASLAEEGSQAMELWFPESSSSKTNGFYLRNENGHALNKRNNYPNNITYWTGGADAGSTFKATIVPSDEELFEQLLTLLESYELGDGLNQYQFTGAYEGYDAESINVLKNEGYTPANLTTVQDMLAAIALNMPKAGSFLRIYSVVQDGYVSSTVDESVAAPWNTYFTDNKSQDDETTIWFFDGEKLLNYATGLYANSFTSAAAGGAGVTFDFQEASNGIGNYWVHTSENKFWYAGEPTIDNYSNPAGVANTRFLLEYVTELPITLTEVDGKYFATFSAPVDIEEFSGAAPQKITVDGDYAKYEDAGMTGLPANTGVLLLGTSTEAMAIVGEYTGDVAETGLQPQTASVADSDGLFFDVDSSSDKPGFFMLDSGVVSGGFTAFVTNEDAGGNTGLELVSEEDTNGIGTLENGTLNTENGAVYNIQGQRVNKAQKGVFIQNGKKVVVK